MTWCGLVAPNWNEMAELQKEIHSPSDGRPLSLPSALPTTLSLFSVSFVSVFHSLFLSFSLSVYLSVPLLTFRAMEGLYRETISRHEQKFSSLVPSRCNVPRLFFSSLYPRGHCFRPLRAWIGAEIYPRSRVFNVF